MAQAKDTIPIMSHIPKINKTTFIRKSLYYL